MSGIDLVLDVQPVLHQQMDAARTKIAGFQSVVVVENMLHAEVPLNGVGEFLVGQVAGGRFTCIADGQTAAARQATWEDAAVGQERSLEDTLLSADASIRVDIVSGAQLRRISRAADIIKDHVIGQPEAGADRSASTLARRIGETDARSKVLVGCSRS